MHHYFGGYVVAKSEHGGKKNVLKLISSVRVRLRLRGKNCIKGLERVGVRKISLTSVVHSFESRKHLETTELGENDLLKSVFELFYIVASNNNCFGRSLLLEDLVQ